MSAADAAIVTVGHSTLEIDEFIALLRSASVATVVDVRRHPGSRRLPQFGEDALRSALEAAGIAYRRIEGLGGRRSRAHDVPAEANALWRNQSFHNYADHMESEEFRDALEALLAIERTPDARIALLCSEAVWWRCHRRLIADALLARGVAVAHLMPGGRLSQATITPGGIVQPDGGVRYPAAEDAAGGR